MSESQHVKAGTLDQQMGVVGNFIRESLMKDGRVSDAAAIAYINQFAQEK